MLMLNSVLNHAAPYSWEQGVTYDNRRYALFELNTGDNEYAAEINTFVNGSQRVNVNTLRRVQNPFQLGSFILRKQQKEFRNESVAVPLNLYRYLAHHQLERVLSNSVRLQEKEKWYHPVHRNDLDIALEFNLDVRRYKHKSSGVQDYSEKNPKFYKTPGEAYNAIDEPEKIIIICNVLGNGNSCGPITKENTAEYMPIYIADV